MAGSDADGIVLLAKKAGPTSFSALNSVKKALGTKKVGHTGTLDSFAQGLLVVCTGRLTRLAGNITEFDKTYRAVIHFGAETDTLEYTGQIVREAPLPAPAALREALEQFKGDIMQAPPAFSAIHVDGKRASDLAREGRAQELPARPVRVYSAEIKDLRLDSEGVVEYALVDFSVSKGTYIRSLARDIAAACSSAAHLTGLYRTKVGNFCIQDAAGFSALGDFSIESAVAAEKAAVRAENSRSRNVNAQVQEEQKKKVWANDRQEQALQEEIQTKKRALDEDTAGLCGFEVMHTKTQEAAADFRNGKPLRSANFDRNLHSLLNETSAAVFTPDGCFLGLIYKDETGRVSYKFVISQASPPNAPFPRAPVH